MDIDASDIVGHFKQQYHQESKRVKQLDSAKEECKEKPPKFERDYFYAILRFLELKFDCFKKIIFQNEFSLDLLIEYTKEKFIVDKTMDKCYDAKNYATNLALLFREFNEQKLVKNTKSCTKTLKSFDVKKVWALPIKNWKLN